jgi:RNA polymerase sigma-70 factor (ECF subfamily)
MEVTNPVDFSAFYECHAPNVRGYILRRLHCPEVAEEITQDVFLELWRNRDKLHTLTPGLLYLMAKRRIIDYARHAERNPYASLEASDAVFVLEAQDADPQERVSERDAIDRAFARLTRIQARAVALRASGLKYREIDAAMGMVKNTSKNYVNRGRVVFRAAYRAV